MYICIYGYIYMRMLVPTEARGVEYPGGGTMTVMRVLGTELESLKEQ